MSKLQNKNYVTFFLIIINIAAYILYTISGDMLYNMGSLSVLDIMERGEYYRILTSMFLHGSPDHIFSNMLFLAALGDMLERAIGHGRFAIIYMLAGIGGNLVSMLYELVGGRFYHTIGASGAVFGLIGALLLLLLIHNGTYGQVSLRRMVLALVYMLYSGMKSDITNNAAHIGGLLVGFFLMLILYGYDRRKR